MTFWRQLMDAKFSQRIKDVLSYSKEEAVRLGNTHLSVEHLFLGILRDGEGLAIDILLLLGADLFELKKELENHIKQDNITSISDTDNLPLLKNTERVLKLVYLEARALKDSMIDTGHLLLAILKDENNYATQLLSDENINYEDVKTELENGNFENKADFPSDDDDDVRGPFGTGKTGSGAHLRPKRLTRQFLIILGLILPKPPKKAASILSLAGRQRLSVSPRS